MTPKEKAKELVDKYWSIGEQEWQDTPLTWEEAKQCALIAIDELIKEHYPQDIKRCEYWQKVKEEIKNYGK